MTGIPDELVKKAVKVGTFYDQRRHAIAILEAISLPALLERVEAAEGEAEKAYQAGVRDGLKQGQVQHDALVGKVADAGERIARAIEATCIEEGHIAPDIAIVCGRCSRTTRIARAALTEGTEG